MRRWLWILSLEWLLLILIQVGFKSADETLYLGAILSAIVISSYLATLGDNQSAVLRGIGVSLPFIVYYLTVSVWIEQTLLLTHIVTSLMFIGSSLVGVGFSRIWQQCQTKPDGTVVE